MKVAVVYSSETGNTKQVGEAILKVLPIGTPIFNVEESPDLSAYEFIFLGCWVDKSTADKKAADFFKTVHNKKIGVFVTIGAYPDTEYAEKCMNNICALLKTDNEVVNTFICHGRIDPRLTEKFKSFPKDHPHAMTEERIARHKAASTHPDEVDFANAQSFAIKSLEIFQGVGK